MAYLNQIPHGRVGVDLGVGVGETLGLGAAFCGDVLTGGVAGACGDGVGDAAGATGLGAGEGLRTGEGLTAGTGDAFSPRMLGLPLSYTPATQAIMSVASVPINSAFQPN